MIDDVPLRPSQEAIILGYEGGKMGISAVPGSGKTFTLSHLAARLVGRLTDFGAIEEREVLVVTMTNSAVNTFRRRIADLLREERGLLPYVGYRVRTLHGLAHDIVRMRPGLVGLSETFEIVDERVSADIIRDLAEAWVRSRGDLLVGYLGGTYEMADDPRQISYFLRKNGVELVEEIARETIRFAKDNGKDPADMRRWLEALDPDNFALARIGIDLYEDYQRSLSYRGAVDFDDLVRLAMQAFDSDPDFLLRLQDRWPYILEDEAQDSSRIQDEMLSRLAGEKNREMGLPERPANWVRVGDPNQAIFTTFTTADANILREFLTEPDVQSRPLPVSGRSSLDIIALANELVHWSARDPLIPHLHQTFLQQEIEPTAPGDPQPNPENGLIYLGWDPEKNITPEAELNSVLKSVERWAAENPDRTVAILVPENHRGFRVAEALEERGVPYEELLRSTSATRDAAERLQITCEFLADPTSGRALSRFFSEVWWPLDGWSLRPEGTEEVRELLTHAFRQLRATEDFLWPGAEGGWMPDLEDSPDHPGIGSLERMRTQLQEWLKATLLPIDQLVLTVAQVLFHTQADLALAHKMALLLRSIAENNPDFRLPEMVQELRRIAQNERRFLGFDDATTGYEPKPGLVTVATMHAAKGLEWDRVYLLSVNNYSFPAALPGDSYLAEKWFIRDELNIQAETRRQLELLMNGKAENYVEGEASRQARIDYAQERLRLLYVGITRARFDLSITWNMGRYWDQGRRNTPAAALIALTQFWKERNQS